MAEQPRQMKERPTRLPVGFSVTYQTAGALRQAIAANFSSGGIFIETEEKLPLQSTIELTFRLPNSEEQFVFQCRVVHCQARDTATGRPAGLGMEFVNLTAEAKAKLLATLHEIERAAYQTLPATAAAAAPKVQPVFPSGPGEAVVEMVSEFRHLGPQADHYAVLGVKRSASTEEIQKAFHLFCRQFHPDLHLHNIPPDGLRQLEEVYNKKAVACRVLKNLRSRLQYDYEHKILEASPEISAQRKQTFFKCLLLRKEQPQKAAQAERFLAQALEEAAKGQRSAAITNIKLSLQLNPYDQAALDKLAELEKGGGG